MKYKWKDKVRIKSKKELECISEVTNDMLKNGGTVMTIACLVEDADAYIMKEDGDFHFLWTDEMIECKVEEETKNWADVSIPDDPYTVTYDSPSMNDSMNKNNIHNEIILPRGYIFKDENGNVINATKIVLEKREYPNTYEECCDVLSISSYYKLRYYTYEHGYNEYATSNQLCSLQDKLNILGKLIICRNAYWKLYGDEMGLGKPWEPDNDNICNSIVRHSNEITKKHGWGNFNILEFPTPEMRDTFYENFKKDIEECKELL